VKAGVSRAAKHRGGNEARWWSTKAVDAMAAARKFWSETRPVRTSAQTIDSQAALAKSKVTVGRMVRLEV
jgi:hypothetical protein